MYTIGLQGRDYVTSAARQDAPSQVATRSESELKRLADATGGEYFYAPASPKLADMYARIVQRQENPYVLEVGVPATSLGKNYTVTVEATKDGLTGSNSYAASCPFYCDGFQYPLTFSGDPVDYTGTEFTQYFGDSCREGSGHLGVDWATSDHNVVAAASGWVARRADSGDNGGWGKHVMLGHIVGGARVYTLYAHLSSIDAKLPQASVEPQGASAVKRDQSIGQEGNTGIGSGIHLHFAVLSALPAGVPAAYTGTNFASDKWEASSKDVGRVTYFNPLVYIRDHPVIGQ